MENNEVLNVVAENSEQVVEAAGALVEKAPRRAFVIIGAAAVVAGVSYGVAVLVKKHNAKKEAKKEVKSDEAPKTDEDNTTEK